jgi:hypothetical protein
LLSIYANIGKVSVKTFRVDTNIGINYNKNI